MAHRVENNRATFVVQSAGINRKLAEKLCCGCMKPRIRSHAGQSTGVKSNWTFRGLKRAKGNEDQEFFRLKLPTDRGLLTFRTFEQVIWRSLADNLIRTGGN